MNLNTLPDTKKQTELCWYKGNMTYSNIHTIQNKTRGIAATGIAMAITKQAEMR